MSKKTSKSHSTQHASSKPAQQVTLTLPQAMQQAGAAYENSDWSMAEKLCRLILSANSKYADALNLLGMITAQTQRQAEAAVFFGRAIEVHPENADGHYNRGLALQETGRIEDALASYDRALEIRPLDADTYNNRGNALKELKRPDDALASYGCAIELRPGFADAHNNRGTILQELKRLDEAIVSYDLAIAIFPKHSEAYYNRGIALQELQRLDEALFSYNHAIENKIDYADAYCNRGNVLRELSRPEDALASYDRAIEINPNHADAYFNRGTAFSTMKQPERALANYDQTIAIHPHHADAYCQRGNALRELKRLGESLESYDRCIEISPSHADAYSDRGIALQGLNRINDALESYNHAIGIFPSHANAYCNRGLALQELNQPHEAVASYNRAIEIRPDYAEAYSNRGNALQELNQLNDAVSSYDRALEFRPDFAEVYSNRGNALQDLNQTSAALASYDRAIQIRPLYAEAHWNKSLTLLMSGRLAEGWLLYEWRWRLDIPLSPGRNFTEPLWQGQAALKGKTILLHSEQGLGDSIQFSRYATMVADLGARVILEAERSLVKIFSRIRGVAQIVEKGEPLPDFDYHCPLMSLPLAFNTDLNSIPSTTPYLSCSKEKIAHWTKRLGKKCMPRVGVVWSGGLNPKMQNRSIAFSQFSMLFSDNFEWISLHKEVRETDRIDLATNKILKHFGDEQEDFLDAAALCEIVDIVITIDTSVAHLSGALGKPTFILLPYLADWRWMMNREDSPWYPDIRLYRQPRPDDWGSVLKRVQADLEKWLQR